MYVWLPGWLTSSRARAVSVCHRRWQPRASGLSKASTKLEGGSAAAEAGKCPKLTQRRDARGIMFSQYEMGGRCRDGCRDFDITEIDITESDVTETDIMENDITESDITESDITRKRKLI